MIPIPPREKDSRVIGRKKSLERNDDSVLTVDLHKDGVELELNDLKAVGDAKDAGNALDVGEVKNVGNVKDVGGNQ